AHQRRPIARTTRRCVILDRELGRLSLFNDPVALGQYEFSFVEGGHIAGDAYMAKRVRSIRCDVQLVNHVTSFRESIDKASADRECSRWISEDPLAGISEA